MPTWLHIFFFILTRVEFAQVNKMWAGLHHKKPTSNLQKKMSKNPTYILTVTLKVSESFSI